MSLHDLLSAIMFDVGQSTGAGNGLTDRVRIPPLTPPSTIPYPNFSTATTRSSEDFYNELISGKMINERDFSISRMYKEGRSNPDPERIFLIYLTKFDKEESLIDYTKLVGVCKDEIAAEKFVIRLSNLKLGSGECNYVERSSSFSNILLKDGHFIFKINAEPYEFGSLLL